MGQSFHSEYLTSETTGTDQVKSKMAIRGWRVKDEANQNTKQVDDQSELQKKDKASGKMRWSKSTETKPVDQDQPKEQKSWRPPKSRDKGCWMTCQATIIRAKADHPQSSEVHKTTKPWWQCAANLSLSRQQTNELHTGGDSCVHTIMSTQKRWTRTLLKLPCESASLKLTRWSPMWSSKDHYLPKRDQWINATTGCNMHSTEHGKALYDSSESASIILLGKYNQYRETYV